MKKLKNIEVVSIEYEKYNNEIRRRRIIYFLRGPECLNRQLLRNILIN